jgi:hypothetical protein
MRAASRAGNGSNSNTDTPQSAVFGTLASRT